MAARDALKRLFGTTDDRDPFTFGSAGRQIDLQPFKAKENIKLSSLVGEDFTIDERQAGDITYQEGEPLRKDDMLMMYKKQIEESLGAPLRKRLKHKFFYGTKFRKNMAWANRPKPWRV